MENDISKYGFSKKTIQRNNIESFDFYIKDSGESKTPKPLFLYIIGSGPCSIMMQVKDKISSSVIFRFEKITEKYQLVILTKPFIPFY
ncbi:MAG: hypothetical protein U9P73_07140, partial [Candidatus Cloacimonadota bacterium]|nr:hypothetical protein [Candidatus Cloacimonadota bacterium]